MSRKILPAIIGMGALVLGIGTMALMLNAKSGPAQAETEGTEKSIHVEAMRARMESVPITLTGHGEAISTRSVEISPEISGLVVHLAANLDEGRVVETDEVLFHIDPEPFELRVRDAKAVVAQWASAVTALELEYENEKSRLLALRRATELSRNKFDRAKQSMKEGIVSQADVDEAERELVRTRNEEEQLERAVDVYPIRIEETRSSLASAREKLALAERELEKTRIVAPFAGRVKELKVESDQYVSAGVPAIVLTDDTQLEINVPLDSREARRRLPFNGNGRGGQTGWFAPLKPVECTITWTEDPKAGNWVGILDRIERFDPETRTTTVAVRVSGGKGASAFPLVEGMFCEVAIPGRSMDNVMRLPQKAITFDNTVYTVAEGRLRSKPVQVDRIQDGYALITDGLTEGELVISTRLVNPLENTLCDVTEVSSMLADNR